MGAAQKLFDHQDLWSCIRLCVIGRNVEISRNRNQGGLDSTNPRYLCWNSIWVSIPFHVPLLISGGRGSRHPSKGDRKTYETRGSPWRSIPVPSFGHTWNSGLFVSGRCISETNDVGRWYAFDPSIWYNPAPAWNDGKGIEITDGLWLFNRVENYQNRGRFQWVEVR